MLMFENASSFRIYFIPGFTLLDFLYCKKFVTVAKEQIDDVADLQVSSREPAAAVGCVAKFWQGALKHQ